MKIRDICESTSSGCVASVAQPMVGGTLKRSGVGTGVYGNKKVGNLLTGKKTNKPYANSIKESGNAINEEIDLRFNVVQLSKNQLNEYSIQFFDKYNINKHNQRFKGLLHKMHSNHRVFESIEHSEINHFIEAISKLNSKKKIKVGDKFAVLSCMINPTWEEIEVLGFTVPKEVKEIKMAPDGTINFVRFTDGDRYPRVAHAAVGKHQAEYPAYFSTETEAEQALTYLKLILPENWDIDTSSINDLKFRTGLNENTMKINELRQELEEEDLIIVPGQGHSMKTGFIPHGSEHEGETMKNSLRTIVRLANDLEKRLSDKDQFPEWVSEKVGSIKSMMTSVMQYLASQQDAGKPFEDIPNGGTIAGGVAFEGAKVDRMARHIAKSEREAGKSKKDAENIAWATLNKRGMLDNKNHKKGK